MTQRVIAATDGAAQPNPGPAGWAWVLADADGQPGRGESGFLGHATNNVGELTAVAELLAATDPTVPLEIRIDSQYAMNAVTTWLAKQRQRGYTTIDGKPIKNRALIERIDTLLTGRDVSFQWVRAHQTGGDPLNACVDAAAQQAVRDREGLRWTAPTRTATGTSGNTGADSQARQDTVRSQRTSGSGSPGCAATTKAGKPCPIDPRPSGLCHVHDPAVQCQAITSKGKPCTVATGGGRCARHRGTAHP